ncbi:hypothetical protein Q7P37_004691 [Cladosporium fusiforme]
MAALGGDFGPVSRMGEAWEFRHAFDQARELVQAQDDWCATADQVGVEQMQSYLPQDLKWESLGAFLRGQVHVNTHCYTAPDLQAFIRHSNEFEFPVRAFYHAHQTYLVPEILKRNYGGRPLPSSPTTSGKILHENAITPVDVSDNPVLNAQHVLFEAAKAYKYGLPYHVALAGVTSASAELLGLGDRIGKVKESFDADVALWDSDHLSVGATPVQVWIDGTTQFKDPVELKKLDAQPLGQNVATRFSAGLRNEFENVVFTAISKMLLPGMDEVVAHEPTNVVVKNSKIAVSVFANIPSTPLSNAKPRSSFQHGHFAPSCYGFRIFLGRGRNLRRGCEQRRRQQRARTASAPPSTDYCSSGQQVSRSSLRTRRHASDLSTSFRRKRSQRHERWLPRQEWVVFEGNPLAISSSIVAVADGSGKVDVWD